MSNYDASSITIKSDATRHWEIHRTLVDDYPMKPPEWIARGLEACELAGVHCGYFINRYLDGDKSIPMNKDVDDIFNEILKSEMM